LTVSVADPGLRLRRNEPAEREDPRRRRRAVDASTVRPALTTQAFAQRTLTRTDRLPEAASWKVDGASGVTVATGVGTGVAAGIEGSAVGVG
jgi:hypothetical protein